MRSTHVCGVALALCPFILGEAALAVAPPAPPQAEALGPGITRFRAAGADPVAELPSMALQRPMAPGFLYKPPGHGRRVTTVHSPDPQMAAHVGYLQLNKLSPWAGSTGWPDWELPFVQWAERNGYEIDAGGIRTLAAADVLNSAAANRQS